MILFLLEWLLLAILFTLFAKVTLERSHASRGRKAIAHAAAGLAILLHLAPLIIALLFFGGLGVFAHMLTPAGVVGIAAMPVFIVAQFAINMYGRRKDATSMKRSLSWSPRRFLTAWVVLLAITAMTFWNLTLQARIEIQTVRAQASMVALKYSPPIPPDSLNAAPLYAQAQAAYKAATVPADDAIDHATLDPKSPEVVAFLDRQQKALELFRRAADLPEYHVDVQGDVTAVVSNLGHFRAGARLLQTAARSEAAAGDLENALTDTNRIHRVAYHASQTPLLISALVGIAVNHVAGNATVELLPSVTTADQLNRLKLSDPQATARNFTRALRSEQAYNMASFCDAAEGSTASQMPFSTAPGPLRYLTWNIWLRDDLASFQRVYESLLDLSEQPFWKAAPQLKQIEEDMKSRKIPGLFSNIILPSLLSVRVQAVETQAVEGSALVAFAATRYRLEHGNLPESLDQLVPAYLPAVPTDPLDGKPLRLKKSPDGTLIIYSVGRNLTDDGGQVARVDKNKRAGDVGVQLKAPTKP